MNSIYILLGANLGDRLMQLNSALDALEDSLGNIAKVSAIVETEAWGVEDQPSFLNQVIEVNTFLNPIEALEICQNIENQLGRVRSEKWGARVIDIDILYYENEQINLPNLQIPHPYIQDRKFTLIPLVQIAPEYIHPVLKKSNKELLEICTDPLDVNIYHNHV